MSEANLFVEPERWVRDSQLREFWIMNADLEMIDRHVSIVIDGVPHEFPNREAALSAWEAHADGQRP